MDRTNKGLSLSQDEIKTLFNDLHWATEYPPIMSTEQVAKLLHMPKATVYTMSSRGDFDGCKQRVGKRVLFVRDRLLKTLFNAPTKPKASEKEMSENE